MTTTGSKQHLAENLGACPSCGKTISFEIGENGRPNGSLLHPLPTCAYFDETETPAIVTRMREIAESSFDQRSS